MLKGAPAHRVAVFGTGMAADIAIAYCKEKDFEVVFFTDDLRSGFKDGKEVILWTDFLLRQFEVDALVAGKWQKGDVQFRVNLVCPLILIDEKSVSELTIYNIKQNISKIIQYKGKYQGRRCFFIGNGPSQNIADIEKMSGEITFASNRIYLIFGQTDWRPTFYFIEDILAAKNCAEFLNTYGGEKFFEKECLAYLSPEDSTVFQFNHASSFDRFSKDFTNGVRHAYSVMCSQLQAAYYMGFSEVYLTGVDFKYTVDSAVTGKLFGSVEYLEYKGTANHFIPEYLREGELWCMPDTGRQREFYRYVQDNIVNDSFRVYNASRQSMLDVFPEVSLDSLFKL